MKDWINNLNKINGKPCEKIYFDGNINFKDKFQKNGIINLKDYYQYII